MIWPTPERSGIAFVWRLVFCNTSLFGGFDMLKEQRH